MNVSYSPTARSESAPAIRAATGWSSLTREKDALMSGVLCTRQLRVSGLSEVIAGSAGLPCAGRDNAVLGALGWDVAEPITVFVALHLADEFRAAG
jgi:hypothetical protein